MNIILLILRACSKEYDMQQIGQYAIIKQLGSGGSGIVYLGEDPKSKKQVAIKVFDPSSYSSEIDNTNQNTIDEVKKQFIEDAKTHAKLAKNPNIIDIIGLSELDDGIPYYVMPYLAKSLESELSKQAQSKPMPLLQAVNYLSQLLSALGSIHQLGLVHKDIKPANILLDRRGYVQVSDFGTLNWAVQDEAGHKLDPTYMSPEQCSANAIDIRSDIYSVGVLAFRLLTGTLPSADCHSIRDKIESLPDALDSFVAKALKQDRVLRYRDALDMQKNLQSAMRQIVPSAAKKKTTEEIQQEEQQKQTYLNAEICRLLSLFGEIREENKAVLQQLADAISLEEPFLEQQIKQQYDLLLQQDPHFAEFHTWFQQCEKLLSKQSINENTLAKLRSSGELLANRDAKIINEIIDFKLRQFQVEVTIRSNRLIYAAVLALLFTVAGLSYYFYQQAQDAQTQLNIKTLKDQQRIEKQTAPEREQFDWDKTQSLATLDAYEQFIVSWPQGQYLELALIEIHQIKLAEQAKIELGEAQLEMAQDLDEEYNQPLLITPITQESIKAAEYKKRPIMPVVSKVVKKIQVALNQLGFKLKDNGLLNTETKQAIRKYAKRYRMKSAKANKRLLLHLSNSIEVKNDTLAWLLAKQKNTFSHYKDYLKRYPKGQYYREAQTKLKDLSQ